MCNLFAGDGTFSFEEFVQVMANMGGLSEQSEEDEEKELRQAFTVSGSDLNRSTALSKFRAFTED